MPVASPTPSPLPSLRIGLFGSGQLASHLAPALIAAGHQVTFVWSRNPAHAAALAARLGQQQIRPLIYSLPTLQLSPFSLHAAAPAGTPSTALPSADIYLLAVPDAAVAPLLTAIPWPPHALVAHLAGALSIEVFAAFPQLRGGVFYPLQTFSPGRAIHWPTVPLCIEAPDPAAETTLLALAHSLSQHVRLLDSAQRLRLHVAAVFANNFTNHLLGIADALLTEADLPMALLAPLVRETMEKALAQPPFTVQTGPAVRRDAPTLAIHRLALAGHPTWQALYDQLTASIQQQLAGVSAPPRL